MDNFDRFSYQGSVSLNHFMDDFLGGNHEIKAGIEIEKVLQDAPIWTPQPFQEVYYYDGDIHGYKDVQPNQGRFRVRVIGSEKDTWNINCQTDRWSAFFQDSFTINNRLTFNLGLRYNDARAKIGGQHLIPAGIDIPLLQMLAPDVYKESDLADMNDVIVWKNFAPRLGVVYDIFGDGSTSIKASYGRYADYLVQEYFISLSPTMPYRPLDVRWFDLDMNGVMDLTDDYQVLYMPISVANSDPNDFVVPDLKNPYTDEIIIGINRELFKDFSLGVSYIYKKKNRAIEDVEINRGYTADSQYWVPYTRSEPGEDGVFGTSDDGSVTVYAVADGAPTSKIVLANPDGFKKAYQGVEFVASKRMSNGWTMLASLTLSKSYGNFNAGGGTGSGSSFNTPNWFVNRDGRLGNDRPINLKIQGSVILPLGFVLGGYYTFVSGSPWARYVQIQFPDDPAYDASNPSFVTVNAEAPGTRRGESSTNLDLRIEKFFTVGTFGRLGFFVDILNVMGDYGYNISNNPGGRVYTDDTFVIDSNYGDISGATGQRTFKVSARFTF